MSAKSIISNRSFSFKDDFWNSLKLWYLDFEELINTNFSWESIPYLFSYNKATLFYWSNGSKNILPSLKAMLLKYSKVFWLLYFLMIRFLIVNLN